MQYAKSEKRTFLTSFFIGKRTFLDSLFIRKRTNYKNNYYLCTYKTGAYAIPKNYTVDNRPS